MAIERRGVPVTATNAEQSGERLAGMRLNAA
jgi:hypothetical protein